MNGEEGRKDRRNIFWCVVLKEWKMVWIKNQLRLVLFLYIIIEKYCNFLFFLI